MNILKKIYKKWHTLIWGVAAFCFWIGVWWLAAKGINRVLILPSPARVVGAWFLLSSDLEFWRSVGISVLNVLLGYSVGVVGGTLLAALTFALPIARRFISPLLTVVRATPVASFIVITVIFMQRGRIPAFMVALMVLPIIWGNVSGAFAACDKDLLEMARAYGMNWGRTFANVYIPSAVPALLSGMATSIGLGWKAGIAAEILVFPRHTVGDGIYSAKAYLQTPELFAWTITVIAVSLMFEAAFRLLVSVSQRKKGRGAACLT